MNASLFFLDHPQLKSSVFLNTLGQFISPFLNLSELFPLPAFSLCHEVNWAWPVLTTACGCLQTIYKDRVRWRNQSFNDSLLFGLWVDSPPLLFCPCTFWGETEIYCNCLQLTNYFLFPQLKLFLSFYFFSV